MKADAQTDDRTEHQHEGQPSPESDRRIRLVRAVGQDVVEGPHETGCAVGWCVERGHGCFSESDGCRPVARPRCVR
jgi:hypothetical protein